MRDSAPRTGQKPAAGYGKPMDQRLGAFAGEAENTRPRNIKTLRPYTTETLSFPLLGPITHTAYLRSQLQSLHDLPRRRQPPQQDERHQPFQITKRGAIRSEPPLQGSPECSVNPNMFRKTATYRP